MNRDWFIMAASTVSFYTNEEAYNKTNIQESFQKLSFSNKNCCFCLKIAHFWWKLISSHAKLGIQLEIELEKDCASNSLHFSGHFSCPKIFMVFWSLSKN